MVSSKTGFETLVFKERPEEAEPPDEYTEYTTVAYGLYMEDGTHFGTCIWSEDKFKGKGWYLCNIYIYEHLQKKGYGSELLKRSCEKMWSKNRVPITLLRAGDKAMDRFEWFRKRGFEGVRENLYMTRWP